MSFFGLFNWKGTASKGTASVSAVGGNPPPAAEESVKIDVQSILEAARAIADDLASQTPSISDAKPIPGAPSLRERAMAMKARYDAMPGSLGFDSKFSSFIPKTSAQRRQRVEDLVLLHSLGQGLELEAFSSVTTACELEIRDLVSKEISEISPAFAASENDLVQLAVNQWLNRCFSAHLTMSLMSSLESLHEEKYDPSVKSSDYLESIQGVSQVINLFESYFSGSSKVSTRELMEGLDAFSVHADCVSEGVKLQLEAAYMQTHATAYQIAKMTGATLIVAAAGFIGYYSVHLISAMVKLATADESPDGVVKFTEKQAQALQEFAKDPNAVAEFQSAMKISGEAKDRPERSIRSNPRCVVAFEGDKTWESYCDLVQGLQRTPYIDRINSGTSPLDIVNKDCAPDPELMSGPVYDELRGHRVSSGDGFVCEADATTSTTTTTAPPPPPSPSPSTGTTGAPTGGTVDPNDPGNNGSPSSGGATSKDNTAALAVGVALGSALLAAAIIAGYVKSKQIHNKTPEQSSRIQADQSAAVELKLWSKGVSFYSARGDQNNPNALTRRLPYSVGGADASPQQSVLWKANAYVKSLKTRIIAEYDARVYKIVEKTVAQALRMQGDRINLALRRSPVEMLVYALSTEINVGTDAAPINVQIAQILAGKRTDAPLDVVDSDLQSQVEIVLERAGFVRAPRFKTETVDATTVGVIAAGGAHVQETRLAGAEPQSVTAFLRPQLVQLFGNAQIQGFLGGQQLTVNGRNFTTTSFARLNGATTVDSLFEQSFSGNCVEVFRNVTSLLQDLLKLHSLCSKALTPGNEVKVNGQLLAGITRDHLTAIVLLMKELRIFVQTFVLQDPSATASRSTDHFVAADDFYNAAMPTLAASAVVVDSWDALDTQAVCQIFGISVPSSGGSQQASHAMASTSLDVTQGSRAGTVSLKKEAMQRVLIAKYMHSHKGCKSIADVKQCIETSEDAFSLLLREWMQPLPSFSDLLLSTLNGNQGNLSMTSQDDGGYAYLKLLFPEAAGTRAALRELADLLSQEMQASDTSSASRTRGASPRQVQLAFKGDAASAASVASSSVMHTLTVTNPLAQLDPGTLASPGNEVDQQLVNVVESIGIFVAVELQKQDIRGELRAIADELRRGVDSNECHPELAEEVLAIKLDGDSTKEDVQDELNTLAMGYIGRKYDVQYAAYAHHVGTAVVRSGSSEWTSLRNRVKMSRLGAGADKPSTYADALALQYRGLLRGVLTYGSVLVGIDPDQDVADEAEPGQTAFEAFATDPEAVMNKFLIGQLHLQIQEKEQAQAALKAQLPKGDELPIVSQMRELFELLEEDAQESLDVEVLKRYAGSLSADEEAQFDLPAGIQQLAESIVAASKGDDAQLDQAIQLARLEREMRGLISQKDELQAELDESHAQLQQQREREEASRLEQEQQALREYCKDQKLPMVPDMVVPSSLHAPDVDPLSEAEMERHRILISTTVTTVLQGYPQLVEMDDHAKAQFLRAELRFPSDPGFLAPAKTGVKLEIPKLIDSAKVYLAAVYPVPGSEAKKSDEAAQKLVLALVAEAISSLRNQLSLEDSMLDANLQHYLITDSAHCVSVKTVKDVVDRFVEGADGSEQQAAVVSLKDFAVRATTPSHASFFAPTGWTLLHMACMFGKSAPNSPKFIVQANIAGEREDARDVFIKRVLAEHKKVLAADQVVMDQVRAMFLVDLVHAKQNERVKELIARQFTAETPTEGVHEYGVYRAAIISAFGRGARLVSADGTEINTEKALDEFVNKLELIWKKQIPQAGYGSQGDESFARTLHRTVKRNKDTDGPLDMTRAVGSSESADSVQPNTRLLSGSPKDREKYIYGCVRGFSSNPEFEGYSFFFLGEARPATPAELELNRKMKDALITVARENTHISRADVDDAVSSSRPTATTLRGASAQPRRLAKSTPPKDLFGAEGGFRAPGRREDSPYSRAYNYLKTFCEVGPSEMLKEHTRTVRRTTASEAAVKAPADLNSAANRVQFLRALQAAGGGSGKFADLPKDVKKLLGKEDTPLRRAFVNFFNHNPDFDFSPLGEWTENALTRGTRAVGGKTSQLSDFLGVSLSSVVSKRTEAADYAPVILEFIQNGEQAAQDKAEEIDAAKARVARPLRPVRRGQLPETELLEETSLSGPFPAAFMQRRLVLGEGDPTGSSEEASVATRSVSFQQGLEFSEPDVMLTSTPRPRGSFDAARSMRKKQDAVPKAVRDVFANPPASGGLRSRTTSSVAAQPAPLEVKFVTNSHVLSSTRQPVHMYYQKGTKGQILNPVYYDPRSGTVLQSSQVEQANPREGAIIPVTFLEAFDDGSHSAYVKSHQVLEQDAVYWLKQFLISNHQTQLDDVLVASLPDVLSFPASKLSGMIEIIVEHIQARQKVYQEPRTPGQQVAKVRVFNNGADFVSEAIQIIEEHIEELIVESIESVSKDESQGGLTPQQVKDLAVQVMRFRAADASGIKRVLYVE